MELTTGFAAITVLPADTVGSGHPNDLKKETLRRV